MHIHFDGDANQINLFAGPFLSTEHSFVDISSTIDDAVFPAENAYDRLLTLFKSHSPWKVTPELLFCICRILEESLLSSRLAPIGPSHRTLLPILRKLRPWRMMERRTLEELASDLAGVVDVELSTSSDQTFEGNVKRKTRLAIGDAEDKENTPAVKKLIPMHPRTMRESKRNQHMPSLNDLLGEPLPPSHGCIACAALRAASRSGANLQNVRRALHHTHDNDGLAFPRPPPPASILHSRSKAQVSLAPKSYDPVNSPAKVVKPATPGARPALGSLNRETPSISQVTSDINLPISPLKLLVEDETVLSLNEVWIKRCSQEEGWRP